MSITLQLATHTILERFMSASEYINHHVQWDTTMARNSLWFLRHNFSWTDEEVLNVCDIVTTPPPAGINPCLISRAMFDMLDKPRLNRGVNRSRWEELSRLVEGDPGVANCLIFVANEVWAGNTELRVQLGLE
ncbi:MAG: hypothetical protein H6739_25735 [Alphaproteobacteria bacterium]|nr:hypothetical protein [Alphaproteobacteria bacterium]